MNAGLRVCVTLNGRRVERCPECLVGYQRHAPLSRARVSVPDPDSALVRSILPGHRLEIALGYRGEAAHEWRGTVDGWQQGLGKNRHQLTVWAAGPELSLVDVRIREMFLDETAEAIARHVLTASGLPLGRIEAPAVTVPRMTLANVPVWKAMEQLAQTCQRANGEDMSRHALWLGANGAVNWGPHDEPDAESGTPVVGTGAGLIRHTPYAPVRPVGEVETFLLPTMIAGRRFRLRDAARGVDDLKRATRVEHRVLPNKARTMLFYGGEYERF